MPGHVLIAGVSTRAAAESAARAGFAVSAIDAFADLDQHRSVVARSIPRDLGVPFGVRAVARLARTCPDAVAYLSPLDNHPRIVRALAQGRALWGNSPDVLSRARSPVIVRSVLAAHGLSMPRVRSGDTGDVDRDRDADDSAGRRWLVKPFASGGGSRVREWRRGAPVPRRAYIQEFVQGTAGSVVFVAAGGRAVPIGVSRQLIGEAAFGATGYRYCGSLLAPAGDVQFGQDEALVVRACAVAGVLAGELGLVGVNGADFVANRGVPHVIEVNPRWSASMEVVERAYGISVFGSHAAACATGTLPSFDLASARRRTLASGRAVVFSRRDVIVGDTATWLDDEDVRDVPHPGERISVGQPVCSVLATGLDASACHAALVSRAARIYEDMSDWV